VLRAILFDFNGVLVDDEPIHFELFQRVLGEEGMTVDPEDYASRLIGLDERAGFGAVMAAHGETPAAPRIMRLVARKASYYRERIRSQGYPFFPGAVDLVESAAERRLMLGIVSGALREEIEGALRQAALRDRFKVVISAEDVAEGKPDPQGYRRGLEALNSQPPLPERLIHPHEVLAVEDSPSGIEAAAGAGLVTLGVGHSYPAERLAAADLVARDLEGLSLERLQSLFAEESRR
jgi:HAD superfamily hydrolase (TIGR01509 family)